MDAACCCCWTKSKPYEAQPKWQHTDIDICFQSQTNPLAMASITGFSRPKICGNLLVILNFRLFASMSEIRQMYREQKSVTAATRLGEWRVAAINFWNTRRERAENGIGTAAVVPLWPMVGTAQRTHVYYYYFVINNAIRRRINCSIEPQLRAVFVENAFVRCTRNAFSSPHCHCTRVTCVFLFASGFWYSENKLERRINWNWYRWKSLWLNGVCCAGHASLVHSPASITSCCSFSFSW